MDAAPKILAIDDERINLEIVRSLFDAHTYELQLASNGKQGLEIINNHHPNVVLLDIMLPDLNGYDICREIRANKVFDSTKVILVSGKAQVEERLQGYEAGADDYVTKPFLSAELLAKVKVFTKLSMAERELAARVSSMQEQVQDKDALLLQSEKLSALGMLTTGIVHEINNPIGYISSNLITLNEYWQVLRTLLGSYSELEQLAIVGDIAALHKQLEQITQYKQAEDFTFINQDIEDLLSSSILGLARIREIASGIKVFSNCSESVIDEINVNNCIDSVLLMMVSELKYKCTIKKNYAELPPISCYPNQLAQVFMNILVNAAHAIEERGEISITTKQVGNSIVVSIADTGSGIAQENLAALFEPFYTTKPVGIGTGLGLSISKGIVEKHQGKIEVASELGQGTVFTIVLPYDGVQPSADLSF